jgi:DNA-binding NtrC family response regulator
VETQVIGKFHLSNHVDVSVRATVQALRNEGVPLKQAQDVFLRTWIEEALKRNGNNQSLLADSERMHRNTISRMMRRLGMSAEKNWKQRS